MKSGLYITTSDDQLRGRTEKKLQSTSQSQTGTKKIMVTVWWSGSLIHYSFLNPRKIITSEKYTQQIDEIQWKLQCLQPALFNGKEPNSSPWQWLTTSHTNKASKVEGIGLRSFGSSAIFTWPLTKWLPVLQGSQQLFAGKMLLQPAEGRKFFPSVHQIPKRGYLCYRNKQTYFSLAKMCWLSWFLFWFIKMCLSLVIMI